MGGAPLAFLSKKSWHPARHQNQEEVWKREQAAAAEKRSMEELRKQMEDERAKEELFRVARAAGVKTYDDGMPLQLAACAPPPSACAIPRLCSPPPPVLSTLHAPYPARPLLHAH